ncbi:hypothetical protein JL49_01560 [Pseudoalteromonas luteoviolacea]|nr:hypothetical protein JL49_01560 [Pseudoalteromonas luteoviolacea]
MRNYDGKEYRYKSSDFLKSKGVKILSNYLKFQPCKKGLYYDISLYEGGTGVHDKVSARFVAEPSSWENIRKYFVLQTPEQAAKHLEWAEDFDWLVDREEQSESPISAASTFIKSQKKDFQTVVDEGTAIYFIEWSDVNSWSVFWGNEECINFLSFDQG